MNQLDLNNYRISLTEAGLAVGWFRDLGIPRANCDFKDYSQLAGQSTGGQVKQGYARATLSWDKITRFQLFQVEYYQRQMTASTLWLYLTIPRSDGLYSGTAWINIKCKPHVITYTPIVNVREEVLAGVVWTLNNITVLGALY